MKKQSKASLIVGILLIVIGSLLLIQNLIDFYLGRSHIYPLLIMALGLLFLFSIRSREKSGAVIPGTFLFLGGAIILSMNYDPIYDVLSNIYPWTFVLLLLGISFLVFFILKPRDFGLLVPVTVFLLLGTLFLLYDLWIIEWESIKQLWPFIPILIGIGIIIHAIAKKSAQPE